jgi:hypothetical protein
VLAIVALPTPAAAAHRVRRVTVSVTPASGAATASFAVTFRAPNRAAPANGRYYEVQASGPANVSGCAATGEASINVARAHTRVTAVLSATSSPRGWCPGAYHGTVVEFQRPVCAPAAPCPQYIILRGTLGKFRFRVMTGGNPTAPTFAGLESAFACTPGAQRPGQTTPFTLTWQPATDPVTPSNEIVYDIYESTTSGGESYSQPTWTTGPGVTTFKTPGLPSHGTFYFVVRARDQAGNEDHNTVERPGVDPCY